MGSSWTEEENTQLVALVKDHGFSWARIAKYIPGKSSKQCRERYQTQLKPGISKEPWSPEEDACLVRLQKIYGNKWAAISKNKELPGRVDNSIKNRWNTSLKKHVEKFIRDLKLRGAPYAQRNSMLAEKVQLALLDMDRNPPAVCSEEQGAGFAAVAPGKNASRLGFELNLSKMAAKRKREKVGGRSSHIAPRGVESISTDDHSVSIALTSLRTTSPRADAGAECLMSLANAAVAKMEPACPPAQHQYKQLSPVNQPHPHPHPHPCYRGWNPSPQDFEPLPPCLPDVEKLQKRKRETVGAECYAPSPCLLDAEMLQKRKREVVRAARQAATTSPDLVELERAAAPRFMAERERQQERMTKLMYVPTSFPRAARDRLLRKVEAPAKHMSKPLHPMNIMEQGPGGLQARGDLKYYFSQSRGQG
jgi:hypothetical protein